MSKKAIKRKREWSWWWKRLVIILLIVVPFQLFGFTFIRVVGDSMEPTLFADQLLLINRFVYINGEPERSDVVIFKQPSFTRLFDLYLVKRVVGVAGDRIEIRAGQLYRNGQLLAEEYSDSLAEDGDYGPFEVSAGHVFVLGDNRRSEASLDSRVFGEVPLETINARVESIVWPLSEAEGLQ